MKNIWKHYTPALQPPFGLVHVVFNDNTEKVTDAKNIKWHAGWRCSDSNWKEKSHPSVVCYASVSESYATSFELGNNRVVNESWESTSKMVQSLFNTVFILNVAHQLLF